MSCLIEKFFISTLLHFFKPTFFYIFTPHDRPTPELVWGCAHVWCEGADMICKPSEDVLLDRKVFHIHTTALFQTHFLLYLHTTRSPDPRTSLGLCTCVV